MLTISSPIDIGLLAGAREHIPIGLDQSSRISWFDIVFIEPSVSRARQVQVDTG